MKGRMGTTDGELYGANPCKRDVDAQGLIDPVLGAPVINSLSTPSAIRHPPFTFV
jgi:hypothetical protein